MKDGIIFSVWALGIICGVFVTFVFMSDLRTTTHKMCDYMVENSYNVAYVEKTDTCLMSDENNGLKPFILVIGD